VRAQEPETLTKEQSKNHKQKVRNLGTGMRARECNAATNNLSVPFQG
jgi:hypothetical protein